MYMFMFRCSTSQAHPNKLTYAFYVDINLLSSMFAAPITL